MKLRIHLVTSALFVGVVVLLTAALLLTAYSKFEQIAPVRNYPAAIPEGSAEQQAYEESFGADLRQRPLMYSFYVGLQNGDFFK